MRIPRRRRPLWPRGGKAGCRHEPEPQGNLTPGFPRGIYSRRSSGCLSGAVAPGWPVSSPGTIYQGLLVVTSVGRGPMPPSGVGLLVATLGRPREATSPPRRPCLTLRVCLAPASRLSSTLAHCLHGSRAFAASRLMPTCDSPSTPGRHIPAPQKTR